MPNIIITPKKNSKKPAIYTREGGRCITKSFVVNISFEFQPPSLPAIEIEGSLVPEDPFFENEGDKSFRFEQIRDGSKREMSVVISFEDGDDLPDIFRLILIIDSITPPIVDLTLSLRTEDIELEERPEDNKAS
jgi:hypothetical protein